MSYDPTSMHNAISKGLAKAIVQKTKEPQPVPREQVVKDLCEWIAKERLSDLEVQAIYDTARNKLRGKTCSICDKWAPIYGGDYTYPGGDLSKPKQFRCADCIEALK